VDADVMSSVYPSGCACAASSAPRVPPAPALFSTITLCPQLSWSFCASGRATTSTGDPGGKGLINRTARVG
jgi:hypothetical protein